MNDDGPFVALRADGGTTLGGGHIVRCLALGRALREAGARPHLFANLEAKPLLAGLDRGGLPVRFVGPGPEALLAAFDAVADPIAALVIDHYDWAAAEEARFRGIVGMIAAIDDLANRPHDCDILIDQNAGRVSADYERLVPVHCERLIGPRYALLRPEFASARTTALARRASVAREGRILVSLGLTDVGGVTSRVVTVLREAGVEAYLDVVLGPIAPSLPSLSASAVPNLQLHVAPPNIPALMTNSDLAVTAAGSTTWERCALGLPGVMLILADNQRAAAKAVSEAGAGFACEADADADLIAATRTLLQDRETRIRMAHAAADLCDGEGARRAASALLRPSVTVRRARAEDALRLLAWRNEASVRAVSRTGDIIEEARHLEWYGRMLEDRERALVIFEAGDQSIGMARFDPNRTKIGPANALWVSILLAPEARGQGLARMALSAAIASAVDRRTPLLAEIKRGNRVSEALFAGLGFVICDAPENSNDFVTYLRS
jgi:UDP-2,4-diacetamido-2,4,6-trideoxy-beta-L-altropyranose hydrolase